MLTAPPHLGREEWVIRGLKTVWVSDAACTGPCGNTEEASEKAPWRKDLLSRKWKVKVKVAQSSPILFNPKDYTVHGILQVRIQKRVAVPFSRGSSQPRDQTQVSCIAGGFFTSWATREALRSWKGRGVTVEQTEVWGSCTSFFPLVLSLGEFSYTSQPLRGNLINKMPTRYLRNTQWSLLRARDWARKQDRRWMGCSPCPPRATSIKGKTSAGTCDYTTARKCPIQDHWCLCVSPLFLYDRHWMKVLDFHHCT